MYNREQLCVLFLLTPPPSIYESSKTCNSAARTCLLTYAFACSRTNASTRIDSHPDCTPCTSILSPSKKNKTLTIIYNIGV